MCGKKMMSRFSFSQHTASMIAYRDISSIEANLKAPPDFRLYASQQGNPIRSFDNAKLALAEDEVSREGK
ncbi:hypothetical protein V9T40_014816 [Parthenolecanium corni]|uniref:Uncharacterized protein n=1 Tax=Parthenolecanium corni TaxID=536013 RepID=A0AAN9T461_9HEMI